MTEARDVDFGLTVSWGVAAQFMMAALGFLGVIVFARVLGPTSFGGYYLLFSVVKVADRPISGAARAVKKRLAEPDGDRSRLFGAGLVAYLAVGAVGVVGGLAANRPLTAFTGVPDAGVVFAVMFLTLGVFELLQKTVSATGRVGVPMWIDAGRSVLTLPAQLGLVVAGLGAAGMAYGLVAATLIVLPVIWLYVEVRPARPARTQFRSLYEFGRYSVLNSLFNRTYRQYDTLLLGFLLTQGAAGQYEVAFKLTLPATFVAGTIGSGLLSRVSNTTSGEAIDRDVTNGLSYASVVAVPLFFGAVAIPEAIVVTVFGGEYRPAAGLLGGLALHRLIASQTRVFTAAIEGSNRPDWTMRVNGLVVGLNVPLGYLLTLEFGLIGVVVATVATQAVNYLAHVWFLADRLGSNLLPSPLRRQLVAGFLMFLFVELAARSVVVRSWVELSGLLALGGLVYFGTLVSISPGFRRTVRSVAASAKR